MKRLLRVSEYSLPYETEEVIENFDITQLLVSRDSLYGAYIDVVSGRPSKTNEPLGVHIDNNNQFILVDGYHRLIDLLFNSVQFTNIKIWGVGYSDYWVTPKDPFEFDFSLKWNGLEDFCDEEGLDDDFEDIYG